MLLLGNGCFTMMGHDGARFGFQMLFDLFRMVCDKMFGLLPEGVPKSKVMARQKRINMQPICFVQKLLEMFALSP